MTLPAERRIKVAVQKSGRLTDNSLHLLETCGLIYSRGRDQLICFGENMPVDVLLVRDDDIPELPGRLGVGHVRYPTIGLGDVADAQPG